MKPVEALRALPGLVERRARLRLELSEVDAELGDVAQAFSDAGVEGRAFVFSACAAVDPDVMREIAEEPPAAAPEPAEPLTHDGPMDQPEVVAAEPVQAEPEAAPEIAPATDEPPVPEPEIVQAPPDGGAPPEVAEPPAEEPAGDRALLSCKDYGLLCGVSEPVIYNAITKGLLDGAAVEHGPPKRIRVAAADRQILERAPAGLLRAGVAKRVERTVVIDAAPESAAMSEADAVRYLRRSDYEVTEPAADGAPWLVNGARLTAERLVEKATTIRGREQRLAAARRSAA